MHVVTKRDELKQEFRALPLVIDHILVGSLRPLEQRALLSGIAKNVVGGITVLTVNGFVGDEQGDKKNHGGPEKAVHHYAREHYPRWTKLIGEQAILKQPGAFGENLSTKGLTETDVAVGDTFKLGGAIIQVSQGRQPCWRLNSRFETPDMALKVQNSGMTGWYYRVLQPGRVKAGNELELIDRLSPEWTIRRIWQTFYLDRMNINELSQIASLAHLPEKWREYARKRVPSGQVEDWEKRLKSP